MKSVEKVRNRLYEAISSGCSKDAILTISRHLDKLIVKQMITKNKKYMTKLSS